MYINTKGECTHVWFTRLYKALILRSNYRDILYNIIIHMILLMCIMLYVYRTFSPEHISEDEARRVFSEIGLLEEQYGNEFSGEYRSHNPIV